MQKRSIYGDLADYYDIIYSWKDYGKEAAKIAALVRKYKKSPGKELLEVACGTGKHANALSKHFKVTGTDINEGMLRVARRKVKGVKFVAADMSKLKLGRQFDVITCLFSSIGYLKTYSRLKRAIEGFARHLKPGGVVIIEPWFTKETFKGGRPHGEIYGNDEIKIARAAVSFVRGDLSTMDMHYLIAHRDKGVKYYVDRHELGLFDTDKFLAYMRDAGLKGQFLKDGLMKDRGLYIGVKG
ncbi:MAG: class I SAM-dependent methyltransferase [Planctomycetes bacterium]|nr:class I SAM-dependent methyltransferase [Planctomycetota bacterium]